MQGRDFLAHARRACAVYGESRWHFLRELAQNARDAGAARIDADAWRTDSGEEVLRFCDDGTGMTLAHARSYLFRLWASSKDGDAGAAGTYGIGFWSVLRFEPESVVVESRTRGGEGWGVRFDGELALARVSCGLRGPGTRVTLVRRALFRDGEELRAEVRERLRACCRHLRRRTRRAEPLPVFFGGRSVAEPMRVGGPVSLSFRSGSVEGVVGLGPAPSVELFARGLPVWNGALLDELSSRAGARGERSEVAGGLAPVFVLNGNALNVVMSRGAVVDDDALEEVREKAKAALSRLAGMHVDAVFPRGLLRRALDGAAGAARALPGGAAAWTALAAALFLVAFLAGRFLPPVVKVRAAAGRPPEAAAPYAGATVEGSPAGAADVSVSWAPPVDAWLTTATADEYDRARGFVQAGAPGVEAAPPRPCAAGCVEARAVFSSGGRRLLPLPAGWEADPASIRLDGGGPVAATISRGELWVTLPAGGGTLRYRFGPGGAAGSTLGAADRARLTTTPVDLVISPAAAALLDGAAGKGVAARVAAARDAARAMVAYDASPATAARYRALGSSGDWLSFVTAEGKGDCDVINGVAALLLRRLGVPARLAIGLTGREGATLPGLHAWVEYFDGEWKIVDASAGEPGGSAPGPAAAPPGPLVHAASTPAAPESAPAAPPAAGAEGERPSGGDVAAAALLVSCAAAFVLAALGLFLVARRGSLSTSYRKDPDAGGRLLGQMIASALADPGAWRHARELWERKVLPLVGGGRASLREALRLSRRGRIFAGSASGGLARLGARGGAVVLDTADETFGAVARRLPGATDLDAIEALRLEPCDGPGGGGGAEAEFLREAGRLLARAGAGRTRLLLARGLKGDELLDIDLDGLRLPPGSPVGGRGIAVSPAGALLAGCVPPGAAGRERALFAFVDEVAGRSSLLEGRRERVRERAAAILLGRAR